MRAPTLQFYFNRANTSGSRTSAHSHVSSSAFIVLLDCLAHRNQRVAPVAMRKVIVHLYCLLFEPTVEMLPSHGRTKEIGSVVKSSCPLNSK
jgi:hypothetical protein